jgi:hypothetical protein
MDEHFEPYIGKTFMNVESQIRSKFSNYKIKVVEYGSMVTCDYWTDRIRIYLDKNNKIERISIG